MKAFNIGSLRKCGFIFGLILYNRGFEAPPWLVATLGLVMWRGDATQTDDGTTTQIRREQRGDAREHGRGSVSTGEPSLIDETNNEAELTICLDSSGSKVCDKDHWPSNRRLLVV